MIVSFAPDKSTITAGDTTTLRWTITGATSAAIDNAVGTVPASSGSVAVSPTQTTTYKLTATSGVGSPVTATATITVNPAGPVSNGQNVTFNVTNKLVYPVDFTVNGSVVLRVAGTSSGSVTVPGTLGLVPGYQMVQPTKTGGTPVGEVMSGVYQALPNPSGTLNYTVNNILSNQAYFVPRITNNSASTLLMGVNMGLQAQNLCECTVPPNSTVQIGYYKYFGNSNVRGYFGNTYTGAYSYWGNDPATPNATLPAAAVDSGLVLLTETSTSGGSGGTGGGSGGSGGTGFVYTGVHTDWVAKLMNAAGGWTSTVPNPPTGPCSQFDPFVRGAVQSAWGAEGQARQGNLSNAATDANIMYGLLQQAYSLCSSAPALTGGSCGNWKYYQCQVIP